MELLSTVLRVAQSDNPSGAFTALAENLRSFLPLRCAIYLGAPGNDRRISWPSDAEASDELLDTAFHVLRPEIFHLGSEFPYDANRYPASEMLAVPMRHQEGRTSTLILIADAGGFGEDLSGWEELATTLQQVEERCERIADAERQCESLRLRVEESEALHTLGLAANRTLDPGEVLNLVARFTRTLLGAHYVTVSTATAGMIKTAASVGLRDSSSAADDYHLASAVVNAEKPLRIGGDGANLQVESFPFHAAEGMKSGLGIPLSLFGDTFGALVVGYRTEREATARDVRLALTLASHAAVAISNAKLHERVEQRSRELQMAYDDLNRATEAKERFFASVNHELRNPLGAVIGYQTLILSRFADALPPLPRQYLEKAQDAANTLKTLVNDLLDLSKLAAGKMEMDFRECAVSDIVLQAMSTIQPAAAAKGIPLEGPSMDGLPVIRTDAKRVTQILVNLLSNAVKFTESGEVQLKVEPPPDAPEEAVEFRVIDSGPGIREEDLEKVFLEFEQVKGTVGGTGLGLPISRRLAGLLGGSLRAESTVGAGSTFILRLQNAPPAEDTHAVPS